MNGMNYIFHIHNNGGCLVKTNQDNRHYQQ